MWRPRKYIFEGAEVNYDPAEEEDSTEEDSCSSSSSSQAEDPVDNVVLMENSKETQETDPNPIATENMMRPPEVAHDDETPKTGSTQKE